MINIKALKSKIIQALINVIGLRRMILLMKKQGNQEVKEQLI